jgi:hypothetical protein
MSEVTDQKPLLKPQAQQCWLKYSWGETKDIRKRHEGGHGWARRWVRGGVSKQQNINKRELRTGETLRN